MTTQYKYCPGCDPATLPSSWQPPPKYLCSLHRPLYKLHYIPLLKISLSCRPQQTVSLGCLRSHSASSSKTFSCNIHTNVVTDSSQTPRSLRWRITILQDTSLSIWSFTMSLVLRRTIRFQAEGHSGKSLNKKVEQLQQRIHGDTGSLTRSAGSESFAPLSRFDG
jgi:hypothetical protein